MTLLLAAALLLASEAAQPSKAPLPPAGRIVRDDVATRVEAELPGSVAGWALPRDGAGGRALLVLVAPAPIAATLSPASPDASCGAGPVRSSFERKEGAVRLYRIDPKADAPRREIRADLPPDSRGLDVADVDGDGLEDLLLLRAGRIDALLAPGFDGEALALGETDLDSYAGDPIRSPDDPFWRLVTVTGLRTYGRGPEGSPLALVSEVPLPQQVRLRSEGLQLTTSEVTTLGKGKDGLTLLASAPEDMGHGRLRSWLLSPEAPPNARTVDCWLRLPAPERVMDSWFFFLDGSPYLATTTTSAEKLGLFSEKLLRLFPLRPDRTRAGTPPMLATQTRMNLWQSPRFHLLDADGDSRQDLVLSYWKGLKNGTIVLDTYLRKPDGTFASSARSQEIEATEEDRSFLEYGEDVDGDSIRDLMILAQGSLQVFRGTRDTKGGRALVEPKPSLRTTLPGAPTGEMRVTVSMGPGGVSADPDRGSTGAPAVVDLDGDGKSEVLFVSGSAQDPGSVTIVSFRGGANAPR